MHPHRRGFRSPQSMTPRITSASNRLQKGRNRCDFHKVGPSKRPTALWVAASGGCLSAKALE